MALLTRLEARVRDLAGRDIEPDAALLAGTGQVKLTTARGPLDLLCRLHDGRACQDPIAHTVELTDGSLRLRVLDLPTLIAINSATGRVRDKLVLPLLHALLRDQGTDPAWDPRDGRRKHPPRLLYPGRTNDRDALVAQVRNSIIGNDRLLDGPFGPHMVTCADYTASYRSASSPCPRG